VQATRHGILRWDLQQTSANRALALSAREFIGHPQLPATGTGQVDGHFPLSLSPFGLSQAFLMT
jgi:hypothetical protein